jgi:toxin ParE1/3/4
MSRRLIVRPEAEADIADAAFWYDEQEVGLGLELIAEVRAAALRVIANPLLHRQLRKEPDVRRILTRRFPYRVFFILREDAIVVFAVLHAARHDRHWQRRM